MVRDDDSQGILIKIFMWLISETNTQSVKGQIALWTYLMAQNPFHGKPFNTIYATYDT